MDKKDRNVKPGDSNIVTKKGFLISPPKRNKDKNQPQESNIKDAKTVNNEEKAQRQGKEKGINKDRHHREHSKFAKKNAVRTENKSENNGDDQNKHQNHQKPLKNRNDRLQREQKNTQPDNKNYKPQNRKEQNKPKQNPPKEKKHGTAGKIDPAILGDLGFVSNVFSKSKPVIEAQNEEPTEVIDYSKAIPLRDQIYPPKKQKPVLTEEEKENKTEIIGIRFKEAGKIYYFDPNGEEVSFGTPVIVETARGLEYGYTAIGNRFIPTESIVSPLKKIIRIATREDTERLEANKRLEKQAEGVFIEKVTKLKLEMSLVGVEYTFDNTKILFYFAAENRIDFRELVKELASVFRTRIELRQVGVRDEAKMLGGLGVCGRPLCCHTFLGEFAQVSIKMAKDQSLSLNSSKISGTCGRLLCCLRYEDEVYQQEYERTPKVDAIVETDEGRGVVVETNPLKGVVRVRLDSKKESPPQAFHRDKVKIVGYLRKNDTTFDAELKELEKE